MSKTKIFIAFVCLLFVVTNSFAQQRYSLDQIINRAKSESPFAIQAETRKENRYWFYRTFKSNYNPQLRLSGNIPNYDNNYFQNRLDSGGIQVQRFNQSDGDLRVSLLQPIAFTGGTISANSSMRRYEDYLAKENLDPIQWNGVPVNVEINQPILGFNQYRWDKKTEPLRFEESKREYVEALENIAQESVDLFFTVLDAQINLQLAEYNLANNDTIYKIEQGRYNIGTTARDKLLQAELQLLRSKQDVTAARIGLQNSKLALRSYIGLKDNENFELRLPEEIPGLILNVDKALEQARNNRAAFIAFERRKIEANREVAQAKGQRYDINLSASYGLSTRGNQFDDVYDGPLSRQQFVNIRFDVPILDWGRNRSRVRTAVANQKLNSYIIAQDEVNFEQEIMTKVAQFEVLLSQIEISKKSDEVAQERYTVSQSRYLIGKVDITNLNNALTEKDAARRSYVDALRQFWFAYYELRRLTLYDFSNDKLLYKPEAK